MEWLFNQFPTGICGMLLIPIWLWMVTRDGKLLSRGGGTIVAKGNDLWAGVGHSAHYTMNGKTVMIMHGYDKLDNGCSKLIIREMKWDRAEWPTIEL
jgi:arabinan endo-1,5-alpha-L-arabinosidase